MHKLIENLQNKSESVKKLIMWLGILFIMTVIFTFWLMTFSSQIPSATNNTATESIKKEIPGIWQKLKEQFNNLKNLKI